LQRQLPRMLQLFHLLGSKQGPSGTNVLTLLQQLSLNTLQVRMLLVLSHTCVCAHV
jgi:hypothetical protein